MTKRAFYWALIFLGIGIILPSFVIVCVEIAVGHISPFVAIEDVFNRQFQEGENLFLLAAWNLIPFAIISIFCLGIAHRLTPMRLTSIALGGLIGILVVMIPSHISIWYPIYHHDPVSSTAVIAFVFVPFFCVATLCIGLFIGWLVSLLPIFRKK